MEGCGFAHRLRDLIIPTAVNPRVWRDRSHERGGPAGIDWFVGQAYSPSQWERVLLYLDSEPVSSMPPWAKRLAWYIGYGDLDEYVCDGDLGWAADARLYFDIGVTYGRDFVRHRFPFVLAEDRRLGMSLQERMFQRMTTGVRGYGLYRARGTWIGAGSSCANDSKSGSGGYDRQYLDVELGCVYVKILVSSDAVPWWYMVSEDALPRVLTRGGWAPPEYFVATGRTLNLYDVPTDELEGVSAQSALQGVAAPLPCGVGGVRVSVDGSVDDRRGIAASCLLSGVSLSNRVSLALKLPGVAGAEASVLLGITLGLLACFESRRMHTRFVFLLDCKTVMDYVFLEQDPIDRDGAQVWPAILLARRLVSQLGGLKIEVSAELVSSGRNLAHHIAKSEMEYRRGRRWDRSDDRWVASLPVSFREVWVQVASNCRSDCRDTSTGFFAMGYVLSREVLCTWPFCLR